MKVIDLKKEPQQSAINQAITVLSAGGLVIFPTETTYGAGVDALNPQGVAKLLAYKARREGKPLSIAVTDIEMAQKYVDVNESARKIYERFLPGPVTVISKSRGVVAPGVESEFGTLGVRIPDYAFLLDLLKQYGRPITATSANISDRKKPYAISDILDDLSEKQSLHIDLILDAGELPHNPPSTVIDTTLSTPVIFRQGNSVLEAATNTWQLTSTSEAETKSIAERIMLKYWNDVKSRGLVIGLNGSLGMGKTIFSKGVAEFLKITDTITSPTYTYIEEYDFVRHGVSGKFFHLDLWKVENAAEFERLRVQELIGAHHVVVIEWVDHVAESLKDLLKRTPTQYVEVNFSEENGVRKLEVNAAQ